MDNTRNPGTSEVTSSMPLREAAYLLGVHEQTLRRWIAAGQLPAIRVGVSGRYRVRREDLDALVRKAA